MKDKLLEREDAIVQLKRDVRYTKIQEIESEARAYATECLRLRQIAEEAVKISGEIDLKHLRRQSEVQIREYKELVEQLRADYEH